MGAEGGAANSQENQVQGQAGLACLLQPLLCSAPRRSQLRWALFTTVSVQTAPTQGPFQLVQERYKSMTNTCNL